MEQQMKISSNEGTKEKKQRKKKTQNPLAKTFAFMRSRGLLSLFLQEIKNPNKTQQAWD